MPNDYLNSVNLNRESNFPYLCMDIEKGKSIPEPPGFYVRDLSRCRGIRDRRSKMKRLISIGEALIAREIPTVPREKTREILTQNLEKIKGGQRDFRF